MMIGVTFGMEVSIFHTQVRAIHKGLKLSDWPFVSPKKKKKKKDYKHLSLGRVTKSWVTWDPPPSPKFGVCLVSLVFGVDSYPHQEGNVLNSGLRGPRLVNSHGSLQGDGGMSLGLRVGWFPTLHPIGQECLGGLGCPIMGHMPFALHLGSWRKVMLTRVWPWLCKASGIGNPLSPTWQPTLLLNGPPWNKYKFRLRYLVNMLHCHLLSLFHVILTQFYECGNLHITIMNTSSNYIDVMYRCIEFIFNMYYLL